MANAGWNRWTPVNLAGIAAHLAGGAVLLAANKGRVTGQQGVAQATAIKTGLTVALGATACPGPWGPSSIRPAISGRGRHRPSGDTPEDAAKAQQQLKLQWGIPILTGAMLIVNARMGEQQRPAQVSGGMFRRMLPGR